MKAMLCWIVVLFSCISTVAQNAAEEGNSQYSIPDADLNDKALKFMDDENYEDALPILDHLVVAFPSVTAYRYNRAVTLFGLELYARSVADYKILFQELADSEYAFQIGNGYEQMDSLGQAIKYYNIAIEMEKDNYLHFFKRGTVLLKMKSFTRAIDDFNAAIALNPEHHNSFHNRGIARYQAKLHRQACEDWCHAAQLGNTISAEHLRTNCKSVPNVCN
jgi:tetratricopeptide (TPR) repeat protein